MKEDLCKHDENMTQLKKSCYTKKNFLLDADILYIMCTKYHAILLLIVII